MNETLLAKRYIDAVRNTLSDSEVIDTYVSISRIIDLILQHQNLWMFLKHPLIRSSDKQKGLAGILTQANGSPVIHSFFSLITAKNRLLLLPIFKSIIAEQMDDISNQIPAIVEAPFDISDTQKKHIISLVQPHIDKVLSPQFKKNQQLLGGFKVRVRHTIYDATIENELDKLRQVLV